MDSFLGITLSTAVPVLLFPALRSVIFYQSLFNHTYCLKSSHQFLSFIFIAYPPSFHTPWPPPRHCLLFLRARFTRLLHSWASFLLSAPPALTYQPFLGPPASLFCILSTSFLALYCHGTTPTITLPCSLSLAPFYPFGPTYRCNLRAFILSQDSIVRQLQGILWAGAEDDIGFVAQFPTWI